MDIFIIKLRSLYLKMSEGKVFYLVMFGACQLSNTEDIHHSSRAMNYILALHFFQNTSKIKWIF